MIQPKPFLDNFNLRHHSIGKERRLNMVKLILDHAPNFPLSVEYEDIDNAFFEWVQNKLDIGFEGKKLPTFRLFSNQRINEYAQSWQHLDDTGNILMNFKTVTRDNNPKKGENQGGNFNIPGNRDYPMFAVLALQENGQEAYDLYTMKQPMSIDFIYTLNLITNKYDLLNEFNQLVNYMFKSLECYIAPNYHAMPMFLDDISDESEYNIDDRKYYSQSYKIKIMAYIIREEDYKVTRLPSRWNTRFLGDKKTRLHKNKKPEIKIEETLCTCNIETPKEERYYNKKLSLYVDFPTCARTAEFIIDTDMNVSDVEITNVYDFIIKINEEIVDLEKDDLEFINGDKISIEIEPDDIFEPSTILFTGIDPNTIIDGDYNPESALDEIDTDEEIIEFKNIKEME